MNLEQAIRYTIEHEGIGIVDEKRFVNYLHDLGAIKQPAMKRILTVMALGGYCSKLLVSINNQDVILVAKDVQMRLVQNEGLNATMVSDVIKAMCSSMGNPLPIAENANSQATNSQTSTSSSKSDGLKATFENNLYKIDFNGKSYWLNKQQYKSILRKKNCPDHIIESWLKSYSL